MAIADEIEALERRANNDLDDLVNFGAQIHANKIYLDKAGTKARYATGDKVVIDRPYFDHTWTLTKKLVKDIAAAAKLRLSKTTSS